jgi:hypothetical protein
MTDDRQALITRLEEEAKHQDLYDKDYGKGYLAPLLREAAAALTHVHDTVNQPESVNIDERGIRHVIVGGERVTDQRLAALTGPKNWPDYCWNHDTNRVNCGCEGPTPEGRETWLPDELATKLAETVGYEPDIDGCYIDKAKAGPILAQAISEAQQQVLREVLAEMTSVAEAYADPLSGWNSFAARLDAKLAALTGGTEEK